MTDRPAAPRSTARHSTERISTAESATTRWWWVRHAPIAPPHDQGFAPVDAPADLSDRAALRRVAQRLPTEAVWIESPARRTAMTGAALRELSGAAGAEIQIEPVFVEQDFGDWHGRRYEDVYGSLSAADLRMPALAQPPGGEAFSRTVDRVSPGIEALTRKHSGSDIVAVAHAGTIRAALALAMDLTPRQAISFVIDILSITRLDCHHQSDAPPQWSVVFVNSEAR